jgi:hypothetical protein
MKTYEGGGGNNPPYLTSVLDGDVWSASRPGRFTPVERAPSTYWIGDWVGHSRSGRCEEKKALALAGNRTRTVQPRRPSLYRLPTLLIKAS